MYLTYGILLVMAVALSYSIVKMLQNTFRGGNE